MFYWSQKHFTAICSIRLENILLFVRLKLILPDLIFLPQQWEQINPKVCTQMEVWTKSDFQIRVQDCGTMLNIYTTPLHNTQPSFWPQLVEFWRETSCLTYLVLFDCGVDNEGAVSLSRVLPCLTNLKKLSLSHNKIGDKGMVALAAVLPYLPNLKKLRLNDNQIGNDGVMALAAALPHLPNIEYLLLDGNKFDYKYFKAIRNIIEVHVPQCRVMRQTFSVLHYQAFHNERDDNKNSTVALLKELPVLCLQLLLDEGLKPPHIKDIIAASEQQ